MCKVEVNGNKAQLVRTPWERVRENIVPAVALGLLGTGLLLWRNDSVQDRDIDELRDGMVSLQEAMADLVRQMGDRYTSRDAGDDWAAQRAIDQAQDAMVRAIELRQNAAAETLARVTALMEKYDLSIDGNVDDLKDVKDRLGKLEVRVELRDLGG